MSPRTDPQASDTRTSQVKKLPPDVVSVSTAEMIPAHVRHAAHVSGLRSRHEAREQNKEQTRHNGSHWTNQTHRYRAQNATARAQWHGSELWSPVRDEEAAGSNPVTPTTVMSQDIADGRTQ